jgi:hypothetical protein
MPLIASSTLAISSSARLSGRVQDFSGMSATNFGQAAATFLQATGGSLPPPESEALWLYLANHLLEIPVRT